MRVDSANMRAMSERYDDSTKSTALTVSRISPPGTLGRAHRHDPSVSAHIRPGGYGKSFDNETSDKFELA